MPTPNRPVGRARHVARLALLAPLALGVAGCGTANEGMAVDGVDGCCVTVAEPAAAPPAATMPAAAAAHGGVMANVINKPFAPKPATGEIGSIERLDPRLEKLLAPDAKMEKLAEGFDWSEGPVWDRRAGALLFSDVPQNVVYRWQPGQPGVTEFLRPSGFTGAEPRGGEPGSNGLAIDADGTLFLCQHGDRRVARTEFKRVFTNRVPATMPARFVTIADRYDGKRFNSPNDLCFDGKGNLYFTDPPYGLPKNMLDPTKELDFQGVYRASPDGEVTLLNKGVTRPNGIALAPDEKTLYVASSDPQKAVWMAFPVKEDATLGDGTVFFDATAMAKDKQRNKGLPDGLKVDRQGNLWATGPGGVLVFAPDGTHLGTLRTGQATANCAWGDDGSTLYITADTYLVRLKTLAKGW